MSQKKILCVEDEADIQVVLRIALETLGGFELLLCNSGEAALEQAAALAPDLILLDVMMPRMDGPATFRALRSRQELIDVPIVFMTARVQPEDVRAYKAMGALDVIAKPFDPIALPSLVHELLLRS